MDKIAADDGMYHSKVLPNFRLPVALQMDLFRRLARVVADNLDYIYPESAAIQIIVWLQTFK